MNAPSRVLEPPQLFDLLLAALREPNLIDFDLLQTPLSATSFSKCNAYYPLIYEEGHLGIPINFIKPLFLYGITAFFANSKNDTVMRDTTQVLCTLNPEFYTGWNRRKKLLLLGLVDWETELRFVELVLAKYPKKSILLHHRHFILSHAEKSVPLDLAFAEKRTYFYWPHRLANVIDEPTEVLATELQTTLHFLLRHPEDSGCMNYRGEILCAVLDRGGCVEWLRNEINQICKMLDMFSSDSLTAYSRRLTGLSVRYRSRLFSTTLHHIDWKDGI